MTNALLELICTLLILEIRYYYISIVKGSLKNVLQAILSHFILFPIPLPRDDFQITKCHIQ